MPAATVTQYPVYTGEFLVQVVDVTEEDSQYGRQYKLKCEFVDVPKQHEVCGKSINIWASITWSLQDPAKVKDIRSKIVKITEAAFNRKIAVGEWCEADYLQGRKFIVALHEKDEGKQGVGAFKPYSKQPPMPAGVISDEAPADDDDFGVGEDPISTPFDGLPEATASVTAAADSATLPEIKTAIISLITKHRVSTADRDAIIEMQTGSVKSIAKLDIDEAPCVLAGLQAHVGETPGEVKNDPFENE